MGGEQGTLLDLPPEREVEIAGDVPEPVARVLLDVPLPHLNQTFDYLVPGDLADLAQPGVRVKVRLAGRLVGGYLAERASTSAYRKLTPLHKVVSPVPVLTAPVRRLVQAVAARQAGAVADVLRHAIVPRHARAEKAHWQSPPAQPGLPSQPLPTAPFDRYRAGGAFWEHLQAGHRPRAVWCALPTAGQQEGSCPAVAGWASPLIAACLAQRALGKGAIVVVPTSRHLEQLVAAWRHTPGTETVQLALWREAEPARRYTEFLRVLRGEARVVFGLRSAVFAPVTDLGLIAVWDDGDDRLAEPSAPYHHARTVALQRAQLEDTALILGGYACSVEAYAVAASGWAHLLQADRPAVRACLAQVRVLDSHDVAQAGPAGAARIPPAAHRVIAAGLEHGPVLVQTARAGHIDALACAKCGQAARCQQCQGPLRPGVPPHSAQQLQCGWCQRPATAPSCPTCGGQSWRWRQIGALRTGEELGRAFPGIRVLVSGTRAAGGVVEQVDDRPTLVVATPGAEPYARGGYRAVVILDTAYTAARPELWAPGEAVRRWCNAATLAAADGTVLLTAGAPTVLTQALVRWDPVGFARHLHAERVELGYPPAVRMARLDGESSQVRQALSELRLPAGAEVLGPSELPEGQARAAVRAPAAQGAALSAALGEMVGVRSARRKPVVAVRVDPSELW
ncbi:hypothetical protein [Buchananella hordeovulneris]|uniref:primosomal protein N' family DNA-binding protein n=1 Tax=Buchananella hordeovulneris TaxID=52770 RepID=UPI000A019156|nr:hypothetical protein [Buchananella hordeovulneris]RRD45388.1 primosomal protein N' [Buchananella hordeovulneris]